ncbi:TetR/AcrR family transcriptional regulator [Kibdelosporangium phytohabitans]|uniref:TetR/AcrR family transcriptional regulator n=1 Tax=Kibdelosporangium phytohabitans TaxID=860235 RepID=UPI001A082A2E|nr:TetR/AcrR family transcriptional regulator [Kibdelosporangium phytohabitans]MBE1467243.1 AcrR family transcriptional regulator [Kibdelosporangium phytohabitans]
MSSRPLRVDAQRNKDRLVEVAAQAFSHDGAETTLESIAKAAGVGIGTLYRHFPTREALVDAVYRNELTRLTDAVGRLLATMEPDAALRAWMDHFIEYMTAKQGMGDALKALIASGGTPYSETRQRLTGALKLLLDASVAAGKIRQDISPWDMVVAMSGIAMAGYQSEHEQVGRLLDLLMDGLRHRA